MEFQLFWNKTKSWKEHRNRREGVVWQAIWQPRRRRNDGIERSVLAALIWNLNVFLSASILWVRDAMNSTKDALIVVTKLHHFGFFVCKQNKNKKLLFWCLEKVVQPNNLPRQRHVRSGTSWRLRSLGVFCLLVFIYFKVKKLARVRTWRKYTGRLFEGFQERQLAVRIGCTNTTEDWTHFPKFQ